MSYVGKQLKIVFIVLGIIALGIIGMIVLIVKLFGS